jgi:hypothetical protein
MFEPSGAVVVDVTDNLSHFPSGAVITCSVTIGAIPGIFCVTVQWQSFGFLHPAIDAKSSNTIPVKAIFFIVEMYLMLCLLYTTVFGFPACCGHSSSI